MSSSRHLHLVHYRTATDRIKGESIEILGSYTHISTGATILFTEDEDSAATFNSSSPTASSITLLLPTVMSPEQRPLVDNGIRRSMYEASSTIETSSILPSRIAFGSCNDQGRQNNLWPIIESRKPVAFVWGGDAIYAGMALKEYIGG
jgi:hypothetical protein